MDWKKIIGEYVEEAQMLLRLFDTKGHTSISNPSWKQLGIPRQGEVGEYQYFFHGIGVRFESDEGYCVEVELLGDLDTIYFDAYRLNSYLYSSDMYDEVSDEDLVTAALERLCAEGYLERHLEMRSYFRVSSA